MKKLLILLMFSFIFNSCSVFAPLQRSKLISVFHLIETSNYDEAKTVIEEMIEDEESSQWSRTWYARGLLAHTAYQEGRRRNNRKMFELYPNQLYIAYSSFEKARQLDGRGRYDRQLAPRYVYLANEFKKQGEGEFNKGNFDNALQAFQQALEITESPILSARTDKDLIFNTAIAAYESNDKEKAIALLNRLNDYTYSPNTSHLLFSIYLGKEDTLRAEQVLREGINIYENNQDLILVLVDLLYDKQEYEQALETLEEAAKKDKENYIFPYTKGLIMQKRDRFAEAIAFYEKAVELAPENWMIHTQIATSYFNIGVGIDEEIRTINSNTLVQQKRQEAAEAFSSSVRWLNKVYENDPEEQDLLRVMFDLYRLLSENDKARSLEMRLN